MRQKPILFSTPMVQALLNTKPNVWPAEPIDPGKPFKSMTRRVIKPQPDKEEPNINYCTIEGFQCAPPGEEIWADTEKGESVQLKPKYEKGDILWVRETWTCKGINDKDLRALISYECGNWAWVQFDDPERYKKCIKKYQIKQPSIFLLREAARLFLEVKSVRVERLQDISEKDANAEGVNLHECDLYDEEREHCKFYVCSACEHQTKKSCFSKLWNMLNAKRGYSWESNPWVWVYEFMKVEK